MGQESEEGGKWQPILGNMNPVKVHVGCKDLIGKRSEMMAEKAKNIENI